ncbi:hypothetical protein AB0J48_20720 [Nocardia salmonicida]|uniref:hypothetical protein n=1 Tax=Nocardia salmonicida TaxID=53431 RepID=UPI00344A9793
MADDPTKGRVIRYANGKAVTEAELRSIARAFGYLDLSEFETAARGGRNHGKGLS